MKSFVLFLCLGLVVTAVPARATTPDCETLAAEASRRYGVPDGLLVAIARTESGLAKEHTDMRAWPWSANVQGTSHYFDTRSEMLAHLDMVMQSDISNFDVGCMQLNYRWHGDGFADLEQMLEPAANVAYAAQYLRQLHDETGSWDGATRYYHSRDPDRGAAYLGRVRQMRAQLARPGFERSGPAPTVKVSASVTVPADQRFQTHQATRYRNDLRSYWERANLAEGALPKMPKRP